MLLQLIFIPNLFIEITQTKTNLMNRARTKTGDIMQVSECSKNEVTYGVIRIKLKRQYANLDEAGMVLFEFLKQLQPAFAIRYTTGAVTACCYSQNRLTVIDYWQDVEKQDWKVKGCTNGRAIAVLYIKNIGQVPVETETSFFNDSGISGT